MGENMRVRGRGLDAGLRGELHITSPGGRLAVNGTLSTADGTYQAYGQKLAIARGIIEAHGGRILLSNREGGGLAVTLILPLLPGTAP